MPLIDRDAALAAISGLPELSAPASTVTPPFIVSPPLPPLGSTASRRLAYGLNHEYSTMWPGDARHRAILLQHPGGAYGLHYQDDGRLYVMLPSEINHASQPRWRRNNADCFLYLYLSEIREFDAGTLKIRTLHRFDLPNINGMGESDISEDDDHLVLCSGLDVFVHQLSTGFDSAKFRAPAAFNSLYITPQNRPLIGIGNGHGTQVLDVDGWPMRLVAGGTAPHMDVSSDVNGSPILVWCNSGDDTGENRNAALAGCPNGIQLTDLTGAKPPQCLLTLDWSIAVHISLPDRAKHVLVSTYVTNDPNSTLPYANENLWIALDGSGVRSLGKHDCDSSTYFGKPRSSVSPDGKRYCYGTRGDVFLGAV